MAQPGRTTPAAAGTGLRTVDALARAAGTTTRQVRAMQTRGLLPRPHMVGRTGFYGDDHLERLRTVLRLQDQGFSLAAIAALVSAWEAGLTLSDVIGLPAPAEAGPVEDTDAFDGVAVPWRGRLLSLVPTTVLDTAAAS
jgi:DNA-binding transcriptional MerR regulator